MILIEKTKDHNCNKRLGNELSFPWKLLIQQEKEDLDDLKNNRKDERNSRRRNGVRGRDTSITVRMTSLKHHGR